MNGKIVSRIPNKICFSTTLPTISSVWIIYEIFSTLLKERTFVLHSIPTRRQSLYIPEVTMEIMYLVDYVFVENK
jgi:hypothetical protein